MVAPLCAFIALHCRVYLGSTQFFHVYFSESLMVETCWNLWTDMAETLLWLDANIRCVMTTCCSVVQRFKEVYQYSAPVTF